jgi:hypothetical protein
MFNRRSNIKAFFVLALLVTLTGCTQSQIVGDLELVVTGMEAVFPAVASAAGLSPAVTQQVAMYLQAVGGATSKASDILAGAGTAQQKASEIVALFAGVAVPVLPAGTAKTVVSAIQLVATAVAKFLTNFQPVKLAARSSAVPQKAPAQTDVAKLQQIHGRAMSVLEKAKGLK